MSSFTKLGYHIVFGTKYRKPVLAKTFREKLYECFGKLIKDRDGKLIEIGGIEDHVHLLAHLSPRWDLSRVIGEIKSLSSHWINEQSFCAELFRWQKGYGAFTVSYSMTRDIQHYIRNQEQHHHQQSFHDEYVGLLQIHDIEFREEYLFQDGHVG